MAGMGLIGLWLLALALLDLVSVPVNSKRSRHYMPHFVDEPEENMVLSGVKGKALYLFKEGKRHLFPDFYTFTAMGFNHTSIHRMVDDKLGALPIGDRVAAIAAPPVFREDDWMFHAHCEDPPRLVNDLGVIVNNGDLYLQHKLVEKVQKTKKLEILALGGSITAGGYFEGFLKLLREEEDIEVVIHNHGHGATDLTYTIFCIEMDHYSPDLVLIDFSVNDYGHPKLMEGLLRKTLVMGKEPPVVALINFWVEKGCPTARYLLHAQYYNVPLLNLCPAVNLCYGRERMPPWRYKLYSTTDGVHPWGSRGVPFIGTILHAWWLRVVQTVTSDKEASISENRGVVSSTTAAQKMDEATSVLLRGRRVLLASDSREVANAHSAAARLEALPKPLYGNSVGSCTRCDALADDADGALEPVGTRQGFKVKTRVKIGFGGFNPDDNSTAGMTKSFRRSYQAERPGDTVSFKFYGKEVKVALWQRRDGMGVLEAMIDDNPALTTKATGFFKGYTWAMERNNTGRSEVIPLFEGLEDKEHTIKFTVTRDPANPYVKGHTCQIFALLSASDRRDCKDILGGRNVKNATRA